MRDASNAVSIAFGDEKDKVLVKCAVDFAEIAKIMRYFLCEE